MRDETSPEIRSVERSGMMLPRVSATFHGRDLFAPAAAWLARGREFAELGPELSAFQRLTWPAPLPAGEGWKTEVVHVDVYGNAITALSAEQAIGMLYVRVCGGQRIPFERFYSAVPNGSPLAVLGSSGFVEVAINQGNAAKELCLAPGSQVSVE
jgi:S-adenosylmethionine hydrolase